MYPLFGNYTTKFIFKRSFITICSFKDIKSYFSSREMLYLKYGKSVSIYYFKIQIKQNKPKKFWMYNEKKSHETVLESKIDYMRYRYYLHFKTLRSIG